MAYLPELQETAQSTMMTDVFLGYDHRPRIQDGAMYDMVNLSGDAYPLLSTRKRRGVVQTLKDPGGLLAKDALCILDDGQLYYGDYHVQGVELSMDEDMMPKQMASMGAYLCIWPDKFYLNTADLSDHGYMDASFETSGNVQLTMCRNDGTDYDMENIHVGDIAPLEPANGMLWLDTSMETHVLKQYSEPTQEWVQVATTYIKITANGIGENFAEYDTVTLSGMKYTGDATGEINAQVDELNGDRIVYAKGDNYLVIAGLIDQTVALDGAMKVSRDVPDCDYITESDNRLWGCKYGMVDGKTVNEIYCCKLGDFKNWKSYMGLSTDSFAATVGTDGVFTGAATLKGYPVFFKENCLHRVGGKTPATFTITTTMCRGVQDGSWQSLAVVGESLYYKGRTDVMVYDGSVPASISEALGGVQYYSASGGAYGSMYYLSMQDGKGVWSLFTLDTARGLWYRQDNLHATHFSAVDDELYCIDQDNKKLLALNGTVGVLEGPVDWQATFGTFGYEYEVQKYLSRFNIRAKIEQGQSVKMEIQYDSDGVWHDQGSMRGMVTKSYMLPVIPRRCDHCQVRLTGKGDMQLYSIARIIEGGGDG